MDGNNKKEYPTLKEVSSVKEVHDRLISCSYSTHRGGMMFNSDSSEYISVELKDGEQIITQTLKKQFENSITNRYKAKNDVLAEVKALADRENMAAWSALKYYQEFFATDISYSEGMTLIFEDGTDKPGIIKNIDLQAVRQQGAGDTANEYYSILSCAAKLGELIQEKDTQVGIIPETPGFSSLPTDAAPSGGRICKCCGAVNSGKFCSECGSKLE